MNYMIFDETGNAIDTFDDADSAHACLKRIVEDDPSAARELALFAFDDDGLAVGEPVIAADVAPDAAQQVTLFPSFFSWNAVSPKTFVDLRSNGGAIQVPAFSTAAQSVC